jgi:glycine betaine/choline ABC-type transport system substrate-binding protein
MIKSSSQNTIGAYMIRTDLEEDFPGIKAVLAVLENTFTLESTIALNYKIDVDNEDPYDVAYEYLKSKNLID